MRSFEFESFEEAYPVLLKALLIDGEIVSPRGILTKEITPVGITILNPRKAHAAKPSFDFSLSLAKRTVSSMSPAIIAQSGPSSVSIAVKTYAPNARSMPS